MDGAKLNAMGEKNRAKALENRDLRNERLDSKLANMSDKDITEELKKKGLGVFGTKAEREQRLRKALGLGKEASNPGAGGGPNKVVGGAPPSGYKNNPAPIETPGVNRHDL